MGARADVRRGVFGVVARPGAHGFGGTPHSDRTWRTPGLADSGVPRKPARTACPAHTGVGSARAAARPSPARTSARTAWPLAQLLRARSLAPSDDSSGRTTVRQRARMPTTSTDMVRRGPS